MTSAIKYTSPNSYPDLSHQEKADFLFREVKLCKATREIFEKADHLRPYQTEKPWTIEFQAGLEFKGYCEYAKRNILLSSNLNFTEALSTFVFELANGAQAGRFLDLYNRMKDGTIGCENYTKQSEQIEFKSIKMHKKAMSSPIARMRWGDDVNVYRLHTDFNTYWNCVKLSNHSEYHRNSWDKTTQRKRGDWRIQYLTTEHYETALKCLCFCLAASYILLSLVSDI